jgi:hypothetical protein
MWEYVLAGAAWKIMGLWTGVDDGVWNPYNTKLQPGTVIPVGSNETSNPSIRPLEVGGDLPFTDWFIQQKQSVIEQALFANPMGDIEDTSVRTLGENMLRVQDMLEEAGASFSLLETEFVQKCIKRVLFILQEQGVLPRADQGGVIEIDGKRISLKMQSPIAQARDAQELVSLQQFNSMALGTIGEALMMRYDQEELLDYIRQKTGVPARILKTEAEVQEAMAQAAQMAQEVPGGGV